MRILGFITLGSAAAAAIAAGVIALKSIPDIRHYRRIRNM